MKNRLLNKNTVIAVLFGFSSGLPLALVLGTLSLWLKDCHIGYKIIGAFSLLRLPYSFKWLWAPLIENVRVPLLGCLGKRRSWAVLAQAGLVFSIGWISTLDPENSLLMMAVAALGISFFSATQDIVLDAFRVELFDKNAKAEVDGATVYVLGHRIGCIVSGAGAIGLAEFLSWNKVYFIVMILQLLGMAAVLWAKEPETEKNFKRDTQSVLRYALIEPFLFFMKKPYWVLALLVVFVYRLSDAYFAPMAYPFYADLGFSKREIAYVSKLYGMIATIVGGLAGGYFINKTGLLKGLLILSVVQGLTTALYIPLYYAGHNLWFFMFTILFENLSSGMATTAIIAFMSVLCNKGQTATQYALLSSLPGFARDFFASTSGWVLEQTSWPTFFFISALMTLPAVGLCAFLYKKRVEYAMKA